MPGKTKEPQSYGSQNDWVTGRTGEQPTDPSAPPAEEHRDFYAEEREGEGNEPHQGGRMSPVTMSENQQRTGRSEGASTPTQAVTARIGGAKRNSFFKRRDYE